MITRLGTKVGTCDEMRLRSGHRVGVSGPANAIPTSAAEARAMLMRDAVVMPEAHAPAFREGLAGLLARWTALQLAILNEWGGAESAQKGDAACDELADWFLRRKGGKYAEDLEELLVEILGDDFNVQCEDGSPREVAKVACEMYERVAQGDYAVARDICARPLPREHLERCARIEEDRRWTAGAAAAAGGETDCFSYDRARVVHAVPRGRPFPVVALHPRFPFDDSTDRSLHPRRRTRDGDGRGRSRGGAGRV
jgi:hypothetical protein